MDLKSEIDLNFVLNKNPHFKNRLKDLSFLSFDFRTINIDSELMRFIDSPVYM